MATKIKYILAIIVIMIVVIASFLLGYNCYPIFNKTPKKSVENKVSSSTPSEVSETTEVTLAPKTTEEDPDLIVEHEFTANVQGETLKIPYQSTKFPKGSQSIVKTNIDMTPVVKQLADSEYKRNWEVGVGVGVNHDRDLYLPLSIQRNYNYDRALEVQVGIAKDHIENIQVSHKWKF